MVLLMYWFHPRQIHDEDERSVFYGRRWILGLSRAQFITGIEVFVDICIGKDMGINFFSAYMTQR